MIVPAYCRTMARYNAWQNRAIWDRIKDMPQAEAEKDRGAFFGSIFATLNHLLWGDQLWMSRFDGGVAPAQSISQSVTLTPTLAVWWAERFRTDGRIRLWAENLSALDLVGDLTWFSGAAGREMRKDAALCITHFFNHQTHHRGQIHAMMTAAGLSPADTDLFLMPEDS